MSAYLYVPDVPGADDGWIELLSYSLGATRTTYKTLGITKKGDQTSTGLVKAVASGRIFGAIVLWVPYGSGAWQITFSFATADSYSNTEGVEYVSFSFETMSSKIEG